MVAYPEVYSEITSSPKIRIGPVQTEGGPKGKPGSIPTRDQVTSYDVPIRLFL